LVIFKKRIPGLSASALERFVRLAARKIAAANSIDVLVTNDQELRALNQRFRGKDSPTDVLSFPAFAEPQSKLAGDIAISAHMALRNSRRLGHSPAEEVKILVLHGLLHLAGFDHERDNGVMARKEQQLRRALGLNAGLIERNKPAAAEDEKLRANAGSLRRRVREVPAGFAGRKR
jgi:probable rRNA maturation factor